MALTWSPDTIWLLMQKAWWFLVVLGVLVAFHELGHFLAARWVGVKVLKFSLGFGPKLFAHQSLWGKVLIVAAGPGFNFILAYLIFAGWLSTGAPLFVPTFRDLSAE